MILEALPAWFDPALYAAPISIKQRKTVVALLAALYGPVAAKLHNRILSACALGAPLGYQTRPPTLYPALIAAAVLVHLVAVVALLSELLLQDAIAAVLLPTKTLLGIWAHPAVLYFTVLAATIAVLYVAVVACFAQVNLKESVTARGNDDLWFANRQLISI